MPEKIDFYSEGSRIWGLLHLPTDLKEGEPRPAIILCHGFAGTKELLLPPYAQRFADEGFVVLSFDYRGWGESEGQERLVSPRAQALDVRAAITLMRSLPHVDPERVGLWGSSLGGATSVWAAYDDGDGRVKALAIQLAFGSGRRMVLGGRSEEEQKKILEGIEKVWAKQVTKGKGMMIPMSKYLPDEQTQAFLAKYGEQFPYLLGKVPFLTTKEMIEANPEELIGKLNMPVLIVGAEKDEVNPPSESRALFDHAKEPKELMMVEGASHYEVYEGEPFEKVAAKQVEFFKRALE